GEGLDGGHGEGAPAGRAAEADDLAVGQGPPPPREDEHLAGRAHEGVAHDGDEDEPEGHDERGQDDCERRAGHRAPPSICCTSTPVSSRSAPITAVTVWGKL